ncbi:MAG: alkaline phosphatase family protein [Armatimonadota bacterium]|nr:alkaline phosphatase family protein [Armatimonadota bacterium]MDR7428193.1 alkaline phosphatase family protein [Armatimonadota bacterium]MDR7469607.1 alkaline phosphatase family protein [Armatimonadota bacterium]MDR7475785.1 alkaline phosphatase family protein [Armatimonadota bacterium]MDR7538327.1 alkaline phosphatase family protein [Armatimonadota bacterium]
MPSAGAHRLVVVGIDGGMLSLAERFMRVGRMPHLSSLAARGVLTEALPSIPVDTPTNWTTIMTGAEPSTHGIYSFTAHIAGEPIQQGQNDPSRNKRSSFSKAEFFWNTLEAAGRRVAVVNYPTGWPSTLRQGAVIGGLTPGGDLWRVAKPVVYATGYPAVTASDLPALQIAWKPLALQPARAWSGVPAGGTRPPLQGQLELGAVSAPVRLPFLLVDSHGAGYDRLILAERDSDRPLAVVQCGQWSPWIEQKVGETRGVFRLKLVHLSPDGHQAEIYVTDIFKVEGWAYPPGLEAEIVRQVGPYLEGLECPYVPVDLNVRPYGPVNISPSLMLEHARMQAEWMVRLAAHLRVAHESEALILHYHYLDALNHTYLGYLSDRLPATTARRTAEAWELYAESYAVVDELIGGVVEAMDDQGTLVVVTSDHAALPCWKYVAITRALLQAGLMAFRWDASTGRYLLDPAQTRVVPYLDPQHIWVNLQGREPDGTVPPNRYEQVREAAVQALLAIRDPETGECPLELVARREELGLAGGAQERIGDVVFFLRPGYTTWDGTLESLRFHAISPERMPQPLVTPSLEVVGHHTPYLPTARLDAFTNSAMTVLAGPGVRAGHRRSTPIRLIDLAPTIAHLLGVPAPRDAQGTVLSDILEPV